MIVDKYKYADNLTANIMMNILNITNGDCAVEIMKKANIPGDFLPWRDVLNEGPIPDNLSLQELSKVRAQYITAQGWGSFDEITKSFQQRDNQLTFCGEYDKVILWFEHDLYDQLQIIQILHWFAKNKSSEVELSMVCTQQYLGRLTIEEMKNHSKYEEPINDAQLQLSCKAWSALRSHSPVMWSGLLNNNTSALPFLNDAILRLLQEFPNSNNGLSRTAEQALKIISGGVKIPKKIFAASQNLEEQIFLGDASFWLILQELMTSNPTLIELPKGMVLTLPPAQDQEFSITETGLKVLAGKINWLDVNRLDRWIGGVHLTVDNIWCWNSDSRTLKNCN